MSERLPMTMFISQDMKKNGGAMISMENILRFPHPEKSPDWLFISPNSPPSRLQLKKIVNTHSINTPLGIQRLPVPQDIPLVRNALKEHDPQHIILNHPDLFTSLMFLSMSKIHRDRTHVIWRGIVDEKPEIREEYRYTFHNLLKWSGFTKRVRRFVGNQAHNLAISHAVADSLVSIGIDASRITVIPNQVGGEYTPYERLNYGDNFRNQFLDPDELGLLIVSRIHPEKGTDWIPEIYRWLSREIQHLNVDALLRRVKIGVAGDQFPVQSGYLELIKKEIELINIEQAHLPKSNAVKIEFFGDQNSQQLQELYNAYDILGMFSPSEGFGRVTAEALMSGMPVIGRKQCRATNELLTEPPYDIGTLVNSPQQAGGEIINVMQNPYDLLTITSNALQWGTKHFTRERAIKGFWAAIGE